jgi:hypothetical protein
MAWFSSTEHVTNLSQISSESSSNSIMQIIYPTDNNWDEAKVDNVMFANDAFDKRMQKNDCEGKPYICILHANLNVKVLYGQWGQKSAYYF